MPSVGVAAGAEHRADAGCGLRRRRAKSGLTLVRLSRTADLTPSTAQRKVKWNTS
jgi:hypothetical protein